MRCVLISGFVLGVLFLSGCLQSISAPTPRSESVDPQLVEPTTFSSWPRVTEKPLRVGPAQWTLCRAPTPQEEAAQKAEAKSYGPHAGYSILVRASLNAVKAYREGKTLPVGSVVIKEKYLDGLASGPMFAYAIMMKREAGYDANGGDWEYAYVTLNPEKKVTRGRLAHCAECHAKAKDRDYLFRVYDSGKPQK